ncbi:MAG: glycosyltransferase 87 family protein [Candidatus Dormibacteraeota bacterium]|nr:glycosyltransferase 87 family protein [Candidatus Dormibacteraeota bacterium]
MKSGRWIGPGWGESCGRAARRQGVLIGTIALLAGGVTLFQWTRPGLLFGEEPDISAYFGGAVRLVHGVLPYRDFVQVEPPGFQVLVSPLALLTNFIGTRNGLALVRLLMVAVAVLNVVLVGRLVRTRGPTAVLVACGLTALAPAVGYALHTVLLEPVVDLFCLLAAGLIFEGDSIASGRRLPAAGLALGFAVSIKVTALVIVVVIVGLCLFSSRRRAGMVIAGVAAGFLLPTLPFLAFAPAAFIRDVFGSQLGRVAGVGGAPIALRLSEITGSFAFTTSGAVAVAVAAVMAGIVAAAFTIRPRRLTSFEWFAVGSAVAACAVQLIPTQYYSQYAAFTVPFIAIALGAALGRLRRPSVQRLGLRIASLALAVLLVNQLGQMRIEGAPDIQATVDAVIPAGACAVADSPNKLVTTDRFIASSPGCTTMTDSYGTELVLGRGSSAYLQTWRAALAHADYFVGQWPLSLDPGIRPYLDANFHALKFGGLLFYIRAGLSAPTAPAPGYRAERGIH